MNNLNMGHWNIVFSQLVTYPAGEALLVPKHLAVHPEAAGARRSMGLPVGQQADFRWIIGDCRGLHVRDFGTHYEAHIDRVDPACDLVEHLRQDSPGSYVAGSAALGALIGALIGSREAVLVGAAIGAVAGALTSRAAEERGKQ